MSKRVHWLWLATKNGISPRQAAGILEKFGTIEAVYTADRAAFIAHGLTKAEVDALCDKDLALAELTADRCDKKHIAVIPQDDGRYPSQLKHLPDPPVVLYARGELPDWDAQPAVAIVGTRKASLYGLRMAERFARGLTAAGFLVISGMALGIDGAANRGALRENGKTIAVLGCGVDICYPAAHQALMEDILLQGAILSEYAPGAEAKAGHFPARNRIISGLCVATIVIEAPARSGSLITAHLALEQGKDVYAVPDTLDAPNSVGSLAMIRDGEAQLLTDPMELVREYRHLLRNEPDEALVRRVFRERTGEEPLPEVEPAAPAAAPADKPRKKGKEPTESLWDVIERRSSRGDKRRAAKKESDTWEVPPGLDPSEQEVLVAIKLGADTPDKLVEATGMNAAQVLAHLTMLELEALISREGNRIELI